MYQRRMTFLLVVWALLILVAPVVADNTHGRPNAQQELQAWFGDAFAPYVVPSNCSPVAPVSGTTLAAFACRGYVRGTLGDLVYAAQAAHAVGPLSAGDGTYWLALHRDLSTALSGWTRETGTSYLWQKATSRPADPPNAIVFAQVTIASGNITTVAVVALPSPLGVSIAGAPSAGNLAFFSFPGSITNGDLTGDVATAGGGITTLQPIVRSLAANTSGDGLVLIDPTAATTGNQRFSPRLRLSGQGSRTNVPAGSRQVDWIMEVQPVQGTNNPQRNLVFSEQVNGAGYTQRVFFDNNGGITAGGTVGGVGLSVTVPTATQGLLSFVEGSTPQWQWIKQTTNQLLLYDPVSAKTLWTTDRGATALLLTPNAASVMQGFGVIQTGPTSGSHGSLLDYNYIHVAGEQGNVGADVNYVNALHVIHDTGGANAWGSRAALNATLTWNGTDNTATTIGDHIAVVGTAIATVNQGGTNVVTDPRGSLFGLSSVSVLLAGATNFHTVSGGEVDVRIDAGASAHDRFGWSLVGVGNQGSVNDMALEIGANSSGSWNTGIAFTTLHGSNPITAAGTLIGTSGTVGTITNGVDFSAYAFTGDFLKSANFRVSGAGQIFVAGTALGAKHLTTTPPAYIGSTVTSVNMNAVGDTALPISLPAGFTRYRVQNIFVSNPSTSLTNTRYGVFTAVASGGTGVVADRAAVVTNNTADANLSLEVVGVSVVASYGTTPLYFHVSQAQGSAATATVQVQIQPLY